MDTGGFGIGLLHMDQDSMIHFIMNRRVREQFVGPRPAA
jgi:hypothetical protein